MCEAFNKFEIGDIVLSIAGRDKGRCFVVIWKEGQFVGICDGDIRKVNKIKKKKFKHMMYKGKVYDILKEKLAMKTKILDSDIRKALVDFN